jgi:hypothetical protein
LWAVEITFGQHPDEFVDTGIQEGFLQQVLQDFDNAGFA